MLIVANSFHKRMASAQNETTCDDGDCGIVQTAVLIVANIFHKKMVSAQNETTCVAGDCWIVQTDSYKCYSNMVSVDNES